ncbi:MAG: hypothetical protein LW768_12575, partial [Rubrivivax sp.]|nr:hypothetical protein [Rubrivivax sp.]
MLTGLVVAPGLAWTTLGATVRAGVATIGVTMFRLALFEELPEGPAAALATVGAAGDSVAGSKLDLRAVGVLL